MKHYTTIGESKKLLELGLNPETADMCYDEDYWAENIAYRNIALNDRNEYLPCWSLCALSEMLPEDITDSEDNYPLVISKSNKGWSVSYSTPYYRNYGVYEECGETLIEAVYGMIVWLIENDYIKKGE